MFFNVGSIYWFVNPQISSSETHPHVCLGQYEDEFLLLLCGTSKFENKKRYFEKNNISYETLVRFQSNPSNTITKDTYVNCNEVQYHSVKNLVSNFTLKERGNVSESEMYQIKNGINISDLLEEDIKQHILSILPDF